MTATTSAPTAPPRPLWTTPITDPDQTAALAAALGCPHVIAGILLNRGIDTPQAATRFLTPTLADLHDPMLMLGMATALERIRRAVENSERILIYGDYDVDGTTAVVLLKTAIESLGTKDRPADVVYHIPHRLKEGYGMQTSVLAIAAETGVRLVISVDTGIRAFAAATEAKALGLDLIVTDHHLPDEAGIPEAVAVLNPSQPGCPYPFKSLCGAAVAFKLAHAILLLSATDEARKHRLQHLLLPSYLKIVAIATIADAVPLVGENRAIALLGLRELANPVQQGLRALMRVASLPLDRAPSATEIAFQIAPRINAAGRMHVASDVVELFLTRDPARALELAERLNRLNEDRRSTEASALNSIDEQLAALREESGDYAEQCIILEHPEWHRGVIGILASRVVDKTARPALILTHEEDQAHGSGRSVEGFHLLDALTAIHYAPATPSDSSASTLFTRFGGHAHAVGFSLPLGNVPELRNRMQQHAGAALRNSTAQHIRSFDAELRLADITPELVTWLERLAPFGIGNKEPVFVTLRARLRSPYRVLKDKHVCLELDDSDANHRFEALGWSRRIDWVDRCRSLSLVPGSIVDVAFTLKPKNRPGFGLAELTLIDLLPG